MGPELVSVNPSERETEGCRALPVHHSVNDNKHEVFCSHFISVSSTLNAILVNAFVGRIISERKHLIESQALFVDFKPDDTEKSEVQIVSTGI